MTLGEAIATLEEYLTLGDMEWLPPSVGAVKLGIEALKRVLGARGTSYQPVTSPLPGETKE